MAEWTPNSIPDDIMKAAGGVVADLHAVIEETFGIILTGGLEHVELLARPIGLAILAERKAAMDHYTEVMAAMAANAEATHD